ncbi:MAG: hypothetical protein ACOC5M_02970, partial [Chloroflexota bacterium]
MAEAASIREAGGRPEEQENEPGALSSLLRRLWSPYTGLVVFLVLYALAGAAYFRGEQTLATLEDDIQTSQRLIRQPLQETEKRELQLQSWKIAYEAVSEVTMLRPVADADLVEAVLATAANSGVSISSATTGSAAGRTVDGREYAAKPLMLSAQGSLNAMRVFLQALESEALNSLTVDSVSLSGGEEGFSLSLRAAVLSNPDAAPAAPDDASAPEDGAR